jgi:hypothetical protein
MFEIGRIYEIVLLDPFDQRRATTSQGRVMSVSTPNVAFKTADGQTVIINTASLAFVSATLLEK